MFCIFSVLKILRRREGGRQTEKKRGIEKEIERERESVNEKKRTQRKNMKNVFIVNL